MKIHIQIFALLIPLFFVSCRAKDSDPQMGNSTVKVRTTNLNRVETSFPINCSGKASSKTEIKLSFKTGGIINQIYTDEGASVKKNQVLAQLDLSEIDALVEQAMLGYEKAQRDLRRAENLYADSVATLEQLQNAKTAVSFAQSQLQIAEFNKIHSVIKAPADGKILKRLGEKNEAIGAGYPLFLFSSSESDWVLRTSLADVDIVKIQMHDKGTIEFDAFQGETFRASVIEKANASDPYTGTYEVELRILSTHKEFISGLIGNASIIPALKREYQTLPLNVLHDAEGMTGFIYLVKGSVYEKRQIDVKHLTDSLIYIESTLSDTDLVITEGAEYLRPGIGLEIVNP